MTQRPQSPPRWPRRNFVLALGGATVLGGAVGLPGRAQARSPAADEGPRLVAVPHVAFGAIVAAIAGTDVELAIDPSLPLATMRLGKGTVSVADRLLLKGSGATRRHYLDDARNAPKLGAAVRDQLRAQWPELGDELARRHNTWSRALVRNILRWTQTLGRSGLRGKRVRDPLGFIYLLEWAGAKVADDGIEPPAGLRDAPHQPSAATADAYDRYVQVLVDAVG